MVAAGYSYLFIIHQKKTALLIKLIIRVSLFQKVKAMAWPWTIPGQNFKWNYLNWVQLEPVEVQFNIVEYPVELS